MIRAGSQGAALMCQPGSRACSSTTAPRFLREQSCTSALPEAATDPGAQQGHQVTQRDPLSTSCPVLPRNYSQHPAEWVFLGCWCIPSHRAGSDPCPSTCQGFHQLSNVCPAMETWIRSLLSLPAPQQGPHTSLGRFGLGTPSLPIKQLRGGSKDGAALLNTRMEFQGADKKHFMVLIELGLSGQKR